MRRLLYCVIVSCLVACGSVFALPAHAAQPDLKVRVLLKKQRQPTGKWFVRIRFRVYNVGAAMAPPSTVGSWCLPEQGRACPALDGHYDVGPPVEPGATGVVRLATPPIAPGGSVVVNGPATMEWQPGSYTIKAKADFPGTVAESIEANNDGRATVTIP